MKFFSGLVGAAAAVFAMTSPALAGEPGKTPLPTYQPAPVHKPVAPVPPAPKYSYSAQQYVPEYTTEQLNAMSYQKVISSAQAAPVITYQQHSYTAPCATPAPCYPAAPAPAPHPCYTGTVSTACQTSSTVTRSYTLPAKTYTRRVSPPCCEQTPRPLPAPGGVAYVPPSTVCPVAAPCYGYGTPAPAAPIAQPAPVYAPPVYTEAPLFIEPAVCEDGIIDRIKNTRDGRRQYAVCFSDIKHLPPGQMNAILLERIETAADKACRDSSSVLYNLYSRRSCEKESIKEAVLDSGVPGLQNAYYSKYYKGAPNVTVGNPILN